MFVFQIIDIATTNVWYFKPNNNWIYVVPSNDKQTKIDQYHFQKASKMIFREAVKSDRIPIFYVVKLDIFIYTYIVNANYLDRYIWSIQMNLKLHC